MFINLHTHHPTLSPGIFEIESIWYGQPKLPRAAYSSVGLHPWYLEGIEFDAAGAWLREQAVKPEILALGEAGLDKVCKTPWDLQLLAFQRCVEISEAFRKPLILHSVRAYSELIALKKAWKPVQSWIFHGFDKPPETAAMLLKSGCFLSFGAALFRDNSKAADSLQATPADRFFLETDDAAVTIEAIYARAAAIRNVDPGALQEIILGTFSRVFNR